MKRSYVNFEFRILNFELLFEIFLGIPAYATVFVEIPLLFHLVEVDGVWLIVILLGFFVTLNELNINRCV